MTQPLRQSTQQAVLIGPLLNDTDFKAREAAISYDAAGIDVDVHKASGAKSDVALAASEGDGYWLHQANGNYSVTLSDALTDTLGPLRVTWYATGVLPGWRDCVVLPAAVYDSLAAGTDMLAVDVQEISGDSAAADNLELAYDGAGYAGGTIKPEVNVVTIAADAITAAVIAQHAIDADSLSADLDSYGARVEIIDDDGAETPADRYCVTWLRNMEMLTTGVTEPKIQVVKLADGTDLVALTDLTAVGSTGAYQYVETTNRIVDGAAYMVLVTATIAAATRTWPHFIGRDSAT
jgi:hypothetical protein